MTVKLVSIGNINESVTDSVMESLSRGNGGEYVIFPGFCDVHVHFREPGFSYKETIKTGSLAAARGGYTDVCTMPNLSPVPDTEEHLETQLDIIKKDACIRVHPLGAITMGEMGEALADMREIAGRIVAFSDDGRGVQSEERMREAMLIAKGLGKVIAAHCEDNSMLKGGYIHDGEYAKAHGHRGICSESEWKQIERDLKLADETGCAYHVCHVSAKESVEVIRDAKKSGVNVTCETAPHYLVLDENDLLDDGRFKMNTPIRARADREALLEGVSDGTVDMIATDHAPHAESEKNKGLSGSSFGIVGLETAFPVLYSELVKKGVLSLKKLTSLLADAPRKRFKIEPSGFSVWDLKAEYEIIPSEFLSMGRATPFEGRKVFGKCMLTVLNGKVVYDGTRRK
ncbi:MAG: dihydroorotase [Clostridia bacterium]|nr:dihydroorotase [Clostridia bacterium]